MAANTRFSTGVHALVLLALDPGALKTSEQVAAELGTNPVVIRRVFSLLQQAELVVSQKGPSGGSRLARSAKEITLRDIYRALDPAPAFHLPELAANGTDGVQKELSRALKRAEEAMTSALEETSLHSLARRQGRAKAH